MKQFNRIFNVGAAHGHESRVTKATTSTNTPPPPMYGLRKDHKHTEDRTKGHPVRPIVGANEAPNSKLSHFISEIVNNYADAANIKTECRSSEEMRAAFEKYNQLNTDMKEQCSVISMDVKALFPSMEWKEIITAVREMIESSELEIESIEWKELGKYLAVTMSEEQINDEDLRSVIPKREKETNRKITVAYLNEKKNKNKWLTARMPNNNEKKKMIAIAVAQGVKACLENHVYCVGDKTFLQKEGGPIGLELTGAVSRPFMARWDRMYAEKIKRAGIKMLLYERYVDDSNQVAVNKPLGARYNRELNKVVVDPQMINVDNVINADERMAKIMLDIANSIMPCIQMEGDWPTKNNDNKLPILDMKVWTDHDSNILYQHYEKPVCSKTVLNAESAHSSACKKSVHTQEVLRRLLNCSNRLDWKTEIAPFVTDYMTRMKIAGYGETYRKEVLKHALNIYFDKWKANNEGSRPIYRPKDYQKEERQRNKNIKKHTWAKKGGHIAPIFVPATPGSLLLKALRQVAEKEGKEGIRFNVVETGGRTMKRELQKSNPTAPPGCSKDDCLCCVGERGRGGPCHKANVNYEVVCMSCPENNRAKYIGETSRNLYTRMGEHSSEQEEEGSFMKKHREEFHNGEEGIFESRVTHVNRDCLSRQVREGVLIKNSSVVTMNTRSEWHQPSLYTIQKEIIRN